MKRGTLSAYFKCFAHKRLAEVEINPSKSNQHEFNGDRALKEMLGLNKVRLATRFVYLSDRDDSITQQDGMVTWYDSRARDPFRTEHRLYYTSNEVMGKGRMGDLMIIALLQDDQGAHDHAFLFIVEGGSQIESQLEWLFSFSASDSNKFISTSEESMDSIELGPQARALLDDLGISVELPVDDVDVDAMLNKFEGKWPSTRDLSAYARQLAGKLIASDDADAALRLWYETEERLFRAYERALVGERVRKGFDSVDDFIQFSLSVHNRRKSRAGHALENHFEQLLIVRDIPHTRNANTEYKSKPDFLFPGKKQYDDPTFASGDLRMLGVKTSCKDRWRQILSEAHRIESKHLLTLDPVVSVNQYDEMTASKVVLVSPYGLRRGNHNGPIVAITVSDFLELVKQ